VGGRDSVLQAGAKLPRNFHFFIPVRQPSIWQRPDVNDVLGETLGFLSEDTYAFSFIAADDPLPVDRYFEFAAEERGVDQIVLFSGGLDSLGGAIQEAVIGEQGVALVSHRSTPKLDSRQQDLIGDLAVWMDELDAPPEEYGRQTHSFLYTCLGTAVARSFGLTHLRSYGSGVAALDLSNSGQTARATAARTIHPQLLSGFARLFGLLLQQDFHIDNPFSWKTKAEIVNLVGNAGFGGLIKNSASCLRRLDLTEPHTHCGVCRKCIDRRFAILASDFADQDPAESYEVDLLTGGRGPGLDTMTLESAIRTARAMESMTDGQFFSTYGEASRILRYLPGSANDVAAQVLGLHRRYGAEVGGVLRRGISNHAMEIHAGQLPNSCAIALGIHDKFRRPRNASEDPIPTKAVGEPTNDKDPGLVPTKTGSSVATSRSPLGRNPTYEAIDVELRSIAQALPRSHEEVFRSIAGRAPIPNAEPLLSAKGWLAGFKRDRIAARVWLSKRWSRLGLPPFPRGPKK
jgi:hypothetical protein